MYPANLTAVATLLIAPNIAFAAGFLTGPAGTGALALLIVTYALILWRTEWRLPAPGFLAACIAIGLTLALLGGEGHFFFQTNDWTVRDAVLLDLTRNPWPVAYDVDGDLMGIRAPLGFYLIPALIGKAFGVWTAEYALLAQTGLMLGLLLHIFSLSVSEGRHRWLVVGLFVAFSGMDAVPWAIQQLGGNLVFNYPHLEIWNGTFQYSSHITQIFWVPNHAIAGWSFVAAYQAWRVGRMPALWIVPIWALGVFWSPLAAFGAMWLLLFALVCDALQRRLRLFDIAAAAVVGFGTLPVALFLRMDAGVVQKGFTIFSPDFLPSYVALMAFEVAPFLIFAWDARDKAAIKTKAELILSKAELILLTVMLALIPLFQFGAANEFAMRCSIPALALVALRMAPAIAGFRTAIPGRRIQMACYLGVAALTPAAEIARVFFIPATPASACNYVEANLSEDLKGRPAQWSKPKADYYIAGADAFASPPGLFRRPDASHAVTSARRDCDREVGRVFIEQVAKPAATPGKS